ncbi:MAG: AraC family transcriptional regulator [Firmicutes bacterium]|nr:AraC family transcriptional regulator [Bacillota bacterium]
MLYFTAPSTAPIRHVSSGRLISTADFLHPKRNLDTFVLIIVLKGTLHIEQNGNAFEIGKNQYILLLAGFKHFGSKPSTGNLEYFWCHFQAQNGYNLLDNEEVSRQLYLIKENTADLYILPEFGNLPQAARAISLFKQLLDSAKRKAYSGYLTHYALSTLIMELSVDFVDGYDDVQVSYTYIRIAEIMDWIRLNRHRTIAIAEIAKEFSYNQNYLSWAFKKYVGISLTNYITRTKINFAKELLLSCKDSIKVIADKVGFKDEKYFMKVFKKMEGISPSRYRNAFYRNHLND